MTDRQQVLVCYDIATADDIGKLRLARAAKICVAFGNRVQDSVYECFLTAGLLVRLKEKLLKIIDTDEDSIRFYRLTGERSEFLTVLGRASGRDPDAPLVF